MKLSITLDLDVDDALIERLTAGEEYPDGGANGYYGERALEVLADVLERQPWCLTRPIGDVVDCEF